MSFNNNILSKIKSIDAEDLYLIENDLCFYEKVSLAFLLFADSKTNAQFILQKLLIISSAPDTTTDILISYTQVNQKNWKSYLVEALAIIKANKVLRKLGLRLSDVRNHFLPHIPEMSLHINPIVKVLYSMCEMLTPIDAGKLVLEVRDTISPQDHLRFYNFDYLEIFLLDWITKRVIDASGSETTDISILIDYFKLNSLQNMRDMLAYSLRDINIRTNDSARRESNELQSNNFVNDCSSSSAEAYQRPEVFQRLEVYHRPVELKMGNCYKIEKESAGFVLIINEQKFHRSTNPELQHLLPKKSLLERSGTDEDKLALEKTFSSFGYRPIVRDDLNHIEVLSNVREIVRRSIMYDSLIVCILTHGCEGSVYACDSIPIKIDDIKKILTEKSLIRKPKMLIIQACQGTNLQRARHDDNLESDAPEEDATDYGDMVQAMSTVPGFASLRHTRTGSWFIQTLCEKINELGDSEHILDILTEVNDEVGNKRGFDNACMTPISSQTLRKKFRLPSRLV
ncbi:caspase-8 [Episyrphus balteatus]|uniref:caspase-8 n=1 Tax=Episyrphus balteatus TaxID=286459 RepID=UPI0024865C87|nr:caspase-8 [Episyrphus balteatus]